MLSHHVPTIAIPKKIFFKKVDLPIRVREDSFSIIILLVFSIKIATLNVLGGHFLDIPPVVGTPRMLQPRRRRFAASSAMASWRTAGTVAKIWIKS